MTADRSLGGHWQLQWERSPPCEKQGHREVRKASERRGGETTSPRQSGGLETDGSNLRRGRFKARFTQGGEPCTCCQLWERSQGRRWEAQERGEMRKEGRGAGGTERTADAEARPGDPGGDTRKQRAMKTRRGGAQAGGGAEWRAGRKPLPPALRVFRLHAHAASRRHQIKSALLYHRAGTRGNGLSG